MPRLRHRDCSPPGANGKLQDLLPAFGKLPQEKRHIVREHLARLILGVVIIGDGVVGFHVEIRSPSNPNCIPSGSSLFVSSCASAWAICVKRVTLAPMRLAASIACSTEKCAGWRFHPSAPSTSTS